MLQYSIRSNLRFKSTTGSSPMEITSQYLYLIYALFFFGTTLFVLLINSIFLKYVKTLGTKNQHAGEIIRWSSETKPAIGGITFFMVFLLSLASYSIFFDPEEVFKNTALLGLLISTVLAFMMGLADDAYNTRPLLKFLVQVLCGVILILSGTTIEITGSVPLNNALTIFWVIGIMNSINMLDNMDAITSVVSVFILVTALSMLYIFGHTGSVDVMITIGILASLVGFLFFNWHPSKMFMGDTGSQFLGLFLAYIGIKYCWNVTSLEQGAIPSQQLSIMILVFLLPLVDTSVVVFNRILRGQSPFIGGRDHTTHLLSYQGLSDSQVALSFAGISAISMISTVFILKFVNPWTMWHALAVLAYFLLILVAMFYLSKINKEKYAG